MDVEDPLKPLDQIFEPDKRQAHLSLTLEKSHHVLASITLHKGVPIEVRQLFETAKNVSLYSSLVYRFHQVSEMVAYSAMEMALRVRYQQDNPTSPRRLMLSFLLDHARKNNWLKDKNFSHGRSSAYKNAEMKKLFEMIDSDVFDSDEPVPVEEPTNEEIEEELEKLDLVGGIVENAAKLRNNLAHGSTTLHADSIANLRLISEVINQIFDDPVSLDN